MNGLGSRRCQRHPAREAVALCPDCRGYFCRECVSEHEGRILCSHCLDAAAPPQHRQRKVVGRLFDLVLGAIGLVTLWLCLYYFGDLLLAIPSSFHEGTIWDSF
jgi:hypothetical protein